MKETPQDFQPVGAATASTEAPDSSAPSPDDRNLAVLAHLSPVAGLIGIPLGTVLGPLIVWLVTKDRSPFLDDQGKEALNFQIGALIVAIILGLALFFGLVLGILVFPLVLALVAGAGLVALVVFVIVVMIMAAVQANKGIWYRYPIRMTFIK